MNEIKALFELDIVNIIMGIFIIMFALQKIIEISTFLLGKFGIETKSERRKKEHETKLSEHDERLSSIDTGLQSLRIANMAVLADRLNQKYKDYMKIGGIPEDEFDEFVQMHDAYKGVGGNHTIDEKYKKAMKFRILTTEEMIDKGLF